MIHALSLTSGRVDRAEAYLRLSDPEDRAQEAARVAWTARDNELLRREVEEERERRKARGKDAGAGALCCAPSDGSLLLVCLAMLSASSGLNWVAIFSLGRSSLLFCVK